MLSDMSLDYCSCHIPIAKSPFVLVPTTDYQEVPWLCSFFDFIKFLLLQPPVCYQLHYYWQCPLNVPRISITKYIGLFAIIMNQVAFPTDEQPVRWIHQIPFSSTVSPPACACWSCSRAWQVFPKWWYHTSGVFLKTYGEISWVKV